MRTFDVILMICGGLVVSEAAIIITLNTIRGYWEPINRFHVLSATIYLVYLSTVIYSSVECNHSDYLCDLLWKICSTLYISVTMAVYSFYYAKSRVVNNINWKGKEWFGRIVFIMIPSMGVLGLVFFWPPIKGVQYNGYLKNGECHLVERRWIAILWVVGDSILSILLLLLFIRPISVIKEILGDTPRSVATLRSMRKMTERNRNLLLLTVTVTISIYSIIAIVGNLSMRTVIYMCSFDRLVTLQCITMTFSYDGREYFYCRACFLLCFQTRTPETEEEDVGYQAMRTRHSNSSSLLISISGTSNFSAEN